jgi:hypothetical protein
MNRGAPSLLPTADIATLGGVSCYILLPTRYNLRASIHIWGFNIGGLGILPPSLSEASVIYE